MYMSVVVLTCASGVSYRSSTTCEHTACNCTQENLKKAKSKKKEDKDLVDKAAQNYLGLLAWGRKVILMDTAILQPKFPKYRLHKLKYFQLPAEGRAGTDLQQKWKQYRDDVHAAHSRTVSQHLEVSSLFLSSVCQQEYAASLLHICPKCSVHTAIACDHELFGLTSLCIVIVNYSASPCTCPSYHATAQFAEHKCALMQAESESLCLASRNALLQEQNRALQQQVESCHVQVQ